MPDDLRAALLAKLQALVPDRNTTAPPMLGVTGALDRAGLVSYDPEGFDETARQAGAEANRGTATDRLAALLGILPKQGERLGQYWMRQAPRSTPPSLAEPLGQDINLPADRKRR